MPLPAGSFVGLVWDDNMRSKVERILLTNPRAGVAHIAAKFGCSATTMRAFFSENPEAMDVLEVGRARGDQAVADKNFSLAMKGDTKALEREMKKRGMLGNDIPQVLPTEQKRDYSSLSLEELEMLAKIDAKTRARATGAGALREIAPPLHP